MRYKPINNVLVLFHVLLRIVNSRMQIADRCLMLCGQAVKWTCYCFMLGV